MRPRSSSWLYAALVLGAGGLAASWWSGSPAPDVPPPAAVAPLGASPSAPSRAPPEAERQRLKALARGPQALQQLTRLYEDSEQGAAREQVLGAVALVGDPAAASWLADVAERDEQLGAHAAQALGSIQDPRAAPELLALVERPGPVHVRANAARALGRSGSSADAAVLLALAADVSEPLRVRQEAALALGRVGGAYEVVALEQLLEQLSSADDAPTRQLRIALVQALGSLGGAAAREALLRHAQRPLGSIEQAFVQQALARR